MGIISRFRNVQNKRRQFIVLLCLVGAFVIGGLLFWNARYSLSAENEAALLSEAEQLVSEDKIAEASEKYDFVASKKFIGKDKSNVYLTQSTICYQYQKLECSIMALDKYEEHSKPDHGIYMTRAAILYTLDRQDEKDEALQKALESLQEQNNLSDEDQELKNSLEKAYQQ